MTFQTERPASLQGQFTRGKPTPSRDEDDTVTPWRPALQRPSARCNLISVLALFVGVPAGLSVHAIWGGHFNYGAGLLTLWASLAAGFFLAVVAAVRKERLWGLTALGLVLNSPALLVVGVGFVGALFNPLMLGFILVVASFAAGARLASRWCNPLETTAAALGCAVVTGSLLALAVAFATSSALELPAEGLLLFTLVSSAVLAAVGQFFTARRRPRFYPFALACTVGLLVVGAGTQLGNLPLDPGLATVASLVLAVACPTALLLPRGQDSFPESVLEAFGSSQPAHRSPR